MSTSGKRAASSTRASAAPAAMINAALLAAAVSIGVWLLVSRGQMTWPPGRLLASLYTLAGCLALVGPIVLARRGHSEAGLGELIWMTAGVLVWVTDIASLFRGEVRPGSWPTPLAYQPMGLVVLAVTVAGARVHGPGHVWSWTNVIGWVLGLFWIGMGLATLWPGAAPLLRS